MSNEIHFLLYSLPEEDGLVQVVVKDETIWATQKAMAQLFGVGVPAISKHLANIYGEGELNESATVSKMEIVQFEGTRQPTTNRQNQPLKYSNCSTPTTRHRPQPTDTHHPTSLHSNPSRFTKRGKLFPAYFIIS